VFPLVHPVDLFGDLQVQGRLTERFLQGADLLVTRIDLAALQARKTVGQKYLTPRAQRRRIDPEFSGQRIQILSLQ